MNADKGNVNVKWIPWLDSAKGFGILLVVLGHASLLGPLNHFLFAFHMPLFFIISGVLFKPRPLGVIFRRKTQSLLVPYFVFAFLTFIYWSVVERRFRPGSYSVPDAAINIVVARGGIEHNPYNVVLWFLPCLFITEIMFSAIHMIVNRGSLGRRAGGIAIVCSCIVSFLIGGWLQSLDLPRLPFTLDIIPFSYGFYAIGYVAKDILPLLSRLAGTPARIRLVLLVPSVFLFAFVAALTLGTGLQVDLNNMVVTSIPVMIVTAVAGTLATLLLCISIDNPIFRYLGGSSLTVICVHDPIKRIVIALVAKVMHVEANAVRAQILPLLVIVGITVLCAVLVHELLKRTVPQVLGMHGRVRTGR